MLKKVNLRKKFAAMGLAVVLSVATFAVPVFAASKEVKLDIWGNDISYGFNGEGYIMQMSDCVSDDGKYNFEVAPNSEIKILNATTKKEMGTIKIGAITAEDTATHDNLMEKGYSITNVGEEANGFKITILGYNGESVFNDGIFCRVYVVGEEAEAKEAAKTGYSKFKVKKETTVGSIAGGGDILGTLNVGDIVEIATPMTEPQYLQVFNEPIEIKYGGIKGYIYTFDLDPTPVSNDTPATSATPASSAPTAQPTASISAQTTTTTQSKPATTPPPVTPTATGKYILTGDLNVRTSATTNSKIITVLKKGATPTVLEKTGNWYKIDLGNGKTGFISATYVKETSATATTATTTASAINKTVNTAALNVRAGAGANNNVIGVLHRGDAVTVIGTQNGWAKINYNNGTGFVDGNYLK